MTSYDLSGATADEICEAMGIFCLTGSWCQVKVEDWESGIRITAYEAGAQVSASLTTKPDSGYEMLHYNRNTGLETKCVVDRNGKTLLYTRRLDPTIFQLREPEVCTEEDPQVGARIGDIAAKTLRLVRKHCPGLSAPMKGQDDYADCF